MPNWRVSLVSPHDDQFEGKENRMKGSVVKRFAVTATLTASLLTATGLASAQGRRGRGEERSQEHTGASQSPKVSAVSLRHSALAPSRFSTKDSAKLFSTR